MQSYDNISTMMSGDQFGRMGYDGVVQGGKARIYPVVDINNATVYRVTVYFKGRFRNPVILPSLSQVSHYLATVTP